MKRARLFTPGPTAVPPDVLDALGMPLIHHRTQTFGDALTEVMGELQYIMQTTDPVVVLSSSGSGAMEACMVNLTAPGEKIIVTELGKFSNRWRDLAKTYGVEVVSVEAEWGTPVTPGQVAEAFDAHPDAVALFTTHSETSTGVLQAVQTFAQIAHDHDALIAVDGITSLGCHDVRTGEWGLDAMVGGSQKGVMVPPGLAYVSLSERAQKKMAGARHASFYFDLVKALKSADKFDTPYTPAISLVFGLQAALRMMRKEGIENVIARHAANAGAVRAAVDAMGLERLATVPSNATTAVRIPDGKAGEVTKKMEHEHSVKIAGGQEHLKGHIVRLGHLGFYDSDDMRTMITAFESVCRDVELVDDTGPGIKALNASYAEAGR